MSISLSFFILAVVFSTSMISGVLGMAGGMILMGVLVWILPVQQAMILHPIAQFFANGTRSFIHRKHIHMPSLGYYALGLLTSCALLSLLAFVPSKAVVFTFLGIIPFLSSVLPKKMSFNILKPLHAYFCGVLVSALQLVGGVSGPLLDIFYQGASLTRHQVVATKASTQTISHIARIIYFSVILPLPEDSGQLPLWLCFAVIPVAVAGTALSKHFLDRLTEKQFTKTTQMILWAFGVVYIYKAGDLWLEKFLS